MNRVRSSRRAAALQPGDYDHEIILINDEAPQERPSSVEDPTLTTTDTTSRLLPNGENGEASRSANHNGDGDDGTDESESESEFDRDDIEGQPRDEELQQNAASSKVKGKTRLQCGHAVRSPRSPPRSERQSTSPSRPSRPTIQIQGCDEPDDEDGAAFHAMPRRRRAKKRETAIDILYENERGGFLCGVALFSGAALGGLDPTPWTNGFHKASPTNTHTAQVPDPSWEWVWPEWRIYRQEGTEEDGWEYSFFFSRRFSWHKPKWYNSFVRRRAWIRRRAKRRPEDIPADYHMCNDEYFTVVATTHERDRGGSVTSSHFSRSSFLRGDAEADEQRPPIEDIDMLMHILRHCRIDREKREAVDNYLEHAIDLAALQNEMHEIMSLFIFQASRRQLLSHFMHKYEETMDHLAKGETLELKLSKDALGSAITHAEEEIRNLAYWSDVKKMAENGEFLAPVDARDAAWHGLDKSSPCPPCKPSGDPSKAEESTRTSDSSSEGSSMDSLSAAKLP